MGCIDMEHAVFCKHLLYLGEVSNSTVSMLNAYFLLATQLPLFFNCVGQTLVCLDFPLKVVF